MIPAPLLAASLSRSATFFSEGRINLEENSLGVLNVDIEAPLPEKMF